MEKRNYLIIDASEVGLINFDEVLETSFETMRFNLDGSKTLIKWNYDGFPIFAKNMLTAQGPYTTEQIIEILKTEEWSGKITAE